MQSVRQMVCVLMLIGSCATVLSSHAQGQEPFSFGVIADVQYSDKATAGARHYRESLAKLEECVTVLNRRDLAFTIQLGDIIDGNKSPEKTLSDLDRVLENFNKLSIPKFHVVGNHCLTAGKENLQRKLDLDRFYYDFTVAAAPGWRFVVLDGNDAGYGILGAAQLEWLEGKLTRAAAQGERVIVFNHFALLQEAAKHHRMKEPAPVLKRITESDCVVAYFAGHDHAGGYAFQDGIHHVTLKGMVEAPMRNAFAVIEVHPEKLDETGFGKEPSREMKIR